MPARQVQQRLSRVGGAGTGLPGREIPSANSCLLWRSFVAELKMVMEVRTDGRGLTSVIDSVGDTCGGYSEWSDAEKLAGWCTA